VDAHLHGARAGLGLRDVDDLDPDALARLGYGFHGYLLGQSSRPGWAHLRLNLDWARGLNSLAINRLEQFARPWAQACHPERSEGSRRRGTPDAEILRSAQDGRDQPFCKPREARQRRTSRRRQPALPAEAAAPAAETAL